MGIVFNIQRASFHDGPGIRTVVFLKGCKLSCIWCHNPESISFLPQSMDHEVVGKKMTVDEVMSVVMLDNDYYQNSGGGITISGGEPMAQPDFTREILMTAKKKTSKYLYRNKRVCPKKAF